MFLHYLEITSAKPALPNLLPHGWVSIYLIHVFQFFISYGGLRLPRPGQSFNNFSVNDNIPLADTHFVIKIWARDRTPLVRLLWIYCTVVQQIYMYGW